MRRERQCSSIGFTLLEVIISLFIFTLVIFLFIGLSSTALGIHKRALDITYISAEGTRWIEIDEEQDEEQGEIEFTFTAPGATAESIKIEGEYRTGGSKFRYFVPKSIKP
ncbi:MAG: hypothetical protein H9893_04285 [Candidatus Niameybacter stercoravium]|nr:hypothetical protein [Candidatus Niameybacter stercoravium]